MSASRLLRIGTRSSPMALAQVERVRRMLADRRPDVAVEVVPLSTSGDRWQGSLSELGGKGAFTKEVDQALLDGRADLAVHCVKDVPGDRPAPAGTVFAAYLTRDDVRDCLVEPAGSQGPVDPAGSQGPAEPAANGDPVGNQNPIGNRSLVGRRIANLPAGTRVGTSAVRRIAQLALHWPHLTAVPIRGNANSRLARLDAGEYDVLLLAVAGLHRIGMPERVGQVIDVDTFVPAVGSGTLVLQCRQDDEPALEVAEALADRRTGRETEAERTMLHILQGSCSSPIGGYARTEPDGRISLRARVISLDGKTVLDAHEWASDPVVLGTSVAASLLRQGARKILG